MQTEYLNKLSECEQLKKIAAKHFEKTILNWCNECREETVLIPVNEFNAKGLVLNSVNVTKSSDTDYKYRIEAEFLKTFSNNLKAIYILKFWDDFNVFDDVFYTEKFSL